MGTQHTVDNKYIGEMKAEVQNIYIVTPLRLAILGRCNREPGGPAGYVNNTYVSAMAKCDQYNRDGP